MVGWDSVVVVCDVGVVWDRRETKRERERQRGFHYEKCRYMGGYGLGTKKCDGL